MLIPQLSAAKSSLLGNVQIKTERSQHAPEARPRARNIIPENVRQMCRRNSTGYISPVMLQMLVLFCQFQEHLLKYNGCPNSHCHKMETMLHLTDNIPNIPYKNRITTEKMKKNQNLQISKSANAQINDA